ncbi:RNA-directed DNA polymerase [Mariluticola halotolerans]|uniref:RNA-directed DNA polymerase n=1 Tax=Mariluticola halotolerans TaxID=2909283 RepID=UPI0026E2E9B1|nr:RNA-directed DNA polymerase [Mariluticola halotolerans]UJQ95547.1 RNA-directed DNA polymerase [Mariluticola halotolerans]
MPGLDKKVIGEINWAKAARNILVDNRSDFILAPHFDIIFREKSDELVQQLTAALSSGIYEPQLPIQMSVPKQGILSRPGSILLPQDRLLYQGIIEDIIGQLEGQMDRGRTFSHVPADDADHLFAPSFDTWNAFQQRVEQICGECNFILQCDVANFFETLPQHPLINALEGSGCRTESVRLLEKMLTSFKQSVSQGIIQGVFPSDVLGNFYLTDIDGLCALKGLPSARYVDDIYIGFATELDAKIFLNTLIEKLRKVGLNLNPVKTHIKASDALLFEQKEVDLLFDAARAEIAGTKDLVEQGGYGFQGDWINSDDLEDALYQGVDEELLAVRALLDYPADTPDLAEKIDRFCLPYLRSVGDDYGIERAFSGLVERPHLIRHYFSYLNHFARTNPDVRSRIEGMIRANGFYLDYQRMYYLAGVMSCDGVDSATVRHALNWLQDGRIGDPTRAIAAIFVSKFGGVQDKRSVRDMYDDTSPYVKAAILYSGQFFVGADKSVMKKAWRGHSEINALIASSI